MPLLALATAEWICRVRGFGGYPPILMRVGDDEKGTWYAAHRPGIAAFFRRSVGGAGGLRELTFRTPKPPGTYRIGLIGDSAMQGFPQPQPLTNAAFLEAMLNDAWTGRRRAEVLDFACTAVASFVELEILKEALDHQLDLVVIMAGNNEYFGAYGVASRHRAGTGPTAMRFSRWLGRFALPQWLDTLRSEPPAETDGQRQVLMERVAAVGQISPDDPLRSAARRVAQAHLKEMVRLARAKGAAVIVCSLPTNERDLHPIGLDPQPELPPDELRAFQAAMQRGEALMPSAPQAAEAELERAVKLADGHARARYLHARSLTALARHDDALREYVRARDLDPMPWRATSDTNAAARAAAQTELGAGFCDMEEAFRRASPGGAIGWELMDDHVHFSLRGQALFAESVLQAMREIPGAAELVPAGEPPAWDALADRLGRNVYDEYASAMHMQRLFDAEFMVLTNSEAQRRAADRIAEIRSRMPAEDLPAVDEWVTNHMAIDRPICAVVGAKAKARGDHGRAAACFEIAARCAPPASLWRLQYTVETICARKRLQGGITDRERALAREALEVARLLEKFTGLPNPVGTACAGLACYFADQPEPAIHLLEQAVRTMAGREALDVMEILAEAYIGTGRIENARALLQLALNDPALRDSAERMLAAPAFGGPPP